MARRSLRGLKGYYYILEEKKIREYLGIPSRWKLQWLEDANHFIWHATNTKTRRIQEKFKRGEI